MIGKSVLIFFSRDGSTELMARMIAEKTGSELLELKEKKPRRNFILSGYRSASGKRPPLAGDPWSALKDKDRVILGAPIWAGNGNPILNSFLEKADLTGKKVILFTLQADPSLKSTEKVLNKMKETVKSRGGEIVDSRGFHGTSPGKTTSEEYLKEQLESWNINLQS